MRGKIYNLTQLHPEKEMEKHVFHRDQIAHFFRWTYVLKQINERKLKILDFGCGNANLLEVLYRNRKMPERYVGLDIRSQTIQNNSEKYFNLDFAKFYEVDLVNIPSKQIIDLGKDWDYICSFEVIEHVGKQNGNKFCENVKNFMNENTMFLLSTPVYDEIVGPAGNHILEDGSVGEYEYDELKNLLEKHFIIEDHVGTFASIKDYKSSLDIVQLGIFEKAHRFLDPNVLSVMFAPLIEPRNCRNIMWILKKKQERI